MSKYLLDFIKEAKGGSGDSREVERLRMQREAEAKKKQQALASGKGPNPKEIVKISGDRNQMDKAEYLFELLKEAQVDDETAKKVDDFYGRRKDSPWYGKSKSKGSDNKTQTPPQPSTGKKDNTETNKKIDDFYGRRKDSPWYGKDAKK